MCVWTKKRGRMNAAFYFSLPRFPAKEKLRAASFLRVPPGQLLPVEQTCTWRHRETMAGRGIGCVRPLFLALMCLCAAGTVPLPPCCCRCAGGARAAAALSATFVQAWEPWWPGPCAAGALHMQCIRLRGGAGEHCLQNASDRPRCISPHFLS